MNWIVNAWDWFVGSIRALMVASNDAKVVRGRDGYDPRSRKIDTRRLQEIRDGLDAVSDYESRGGSVEGLTLDLGGLKVLGGDVYTPRPFPNLNWDSTTHDLQRTRRAQLRSEIQRLRKNKKKFLHLQAELDAMK